MVSRATAIGTATITGAVTAAVAVTPVLSVTCTAGATVTAAVVASMISATLLLRCRVVAPPVAEHGTKKRRIACANRLEIVRRRPSKCGAEEQLEHIASEKNQQDAAAVYQQ